MEAVPNPHKLLIRPLAGVALAIAGRDLKAEDRRDKFLAAHPEVKIWRDAGGWHARWPVDGTHSGISHPQDLGGLMDRLDALGKLHQAAAAAEPQTLEEEQGEG